MGIMSPSQPDPEVPLRSMSMVAPSPQPGVLAKLQETWPARLAQEIWGGLTLPGDVYQGNVSMVDHDGRTNPQVIGRAADLAGAVMGGTYAGAPAGAIGSGLTRRAKNIDELRAALEAEHPHLKQFVSESPEAVTINKVVVPPDMRGQGVGTTFVRDVLDYADAHGKTTALTPSGAFGGNTKQLNEWYRALGFVPNKGRKAEHSISESMYRLPETVLFRGENAGNKGGNYYSTDKDFARDFTQSGRDSEILRAKLDTGHVFTPKELPFAGDVTAMDAAIAEARAKGFKAIRVNEGPGQPNSVFVFDKSGIGR